MNVFISSVIKDFEAYRDTAVKAVRGLGHDAIRAEDFGASPVSPQEVCLEGVRRSDITVLILGERYGYIQQSGRSATHDEYLEARNRCPMLVFVLAITG